MTARQLGVRLAWASGGVRQVLDELQERRLVARLNTVIPSYVYRYGGVDLDSD